MRWDIVCDEVTVIMEWKCGNGWDCDYIGNCDLKCDWYCNCEYNWVCGYGWFNQMDELVMWLNPWWLIGCLLIVWLLLNCLAW